MLEPILRPPHSFALVNKMTKKSKRKSGRVSANISQADSRVLNIAMEYIAILQPWDFHIYVQKTRPKTSFLKKYSYDT